MEKRWQCNLEPHIAFTDFQKVFYKVYKSELWETWVLGILKSNTSDYKKIQTLALIEEKSKKIKLGTSQGVWQGCNISLLTFELTILSKYGNWSKFRN